MKIRTTVTDLNREQWSRLQERLLTRYEVEPGAARVCAVFQRGELERHAEMPAYDFSTLVTELTMLDRTLVTAQAALTPDILPAYGGAQQDIEHGWMIEDEEEPPYNEHGEARGADESDLTGGNEEVRSNRYPQKLDITDRWYPR